MVIRAKVLEPNQPADPRVEPAAIALFGRIGGDTSEYWDRQTEGVKDSFREDVRSVLAALDAMPKEYTDTYLTPALANDSRPEPTIKPAPRRVIDCDDDRWSLQDDGRWEWDEQPETSYPTLDQLACAYGPLTEV